MNSIDNPFAPGAGTPPPELAGREVILQQAVNAIQRTQKGKAAKSQILLGLRGVGKTVLLNRINQLAEEFGNQTVIFEAVPNHSLPEILSQQLLRLLLKLDRRKKTGKDIQQAFGLLREFASMFKVRIGEFEVGLSPTKLTGDLNTDLGDLLVSVAEAAKARNTIVVILIDEVQYLDNKDLAALILGLHIISQKELPLLLFGAGLPQLAKLAGEAKSYAERLFDYTTIDKLDEESAWQAIEEPVLRENISFEPDAIRQIIQETEGYPYFLQVWGSHVWEVAKTSPIKISDVNVASSRAIFALDSGFFRIRYERLTERQQEYARAMVCVGHLPATSTEVAKIMGIGVRQAAPLRDEIIKKGMAFSPERGLITFSVPKFEDFIKRNYLNKKS
jgi:hypothetical protein